MANLLDIKRVVAIQNYGISGTNLFHSLLDGHPQIISLPLIASLSAYQYLVDNANDIDIEGYLNSISSSELLFNIQPGSEFRMDELGDNADQKLTCDFSKFSAFFKELTGDKQINVKNILTATFQAYNLCFDNSYKGDVMLCLAVHSLPKRYIDFLVKEFDEVKIVHMVREPLQNIGSMLKHIDAIVNHRNVYVSPLRSITTQIISNDEKMSHWGLPATELYGKRPYIQDNDKVESRFIKLEDLHKNGEEALRKFCNWVKLDWNDCLLKSTVMGMLWHNRRESIKQSGLSKEGVIAQEHSNYLRRFDKKRLNTFLAKEKEHFGYDNNNVYPKILAIFLVWLPFKAEFNTNKVRFQRRTIKERYLQSMTITFQDIANSFGRETLDDIKYVKKLLLPMFYVFNFLPRKIVWSLFKINEYIWIRYVMIKKLFVNKVDFVRAL